MDATFAAPAASYPTARPPRAAFALLPLLRPLVTFAVLVFAWWAAVLLFEPEPWLVPSPVAVGAVLFDQAGYFLRHATITAGEIVLGLALGAVLGGGTAVLIHLFAPLRRWVLPLVVSSQALPVFAVAPLLMTWFGLGLGSKVAMATLIIYFPVASALLDGLERVPADWVDLGRTMGLGRWGALRRVRLPAAMPAFASGLRVAATIAPIGAVVGEWVGAAGGLGFVMNQANARLQTDVTFAALICLVVLVVVLRALVVALLDRFVFWSPRTDSS